MKALMFAGCGAGLGALAGLGVMFLRADNDNNNSGHMDDYTAHHRSSIVYPADIQAEPEVYMAFKQLEAFEHTETRPLVMVIQCVQNLIRERKAVFNPQDASLQSDVTRRMIALQQKLDAAMIDLWEKWNVFTGYDGLPIVDSLHIPAASILSFGERIRDSTSRYHLSKKQS